MQIITITKKVLKLNGRNATKVHKLFLYLISQIHYQTVKKTQHFN